MKVYYRVIYANAAMLFIIIIFLLSINKMSKTSEIPFIELMLAIGIPFSSLKKGHRDNPTILESYPKETKNSAYVNSILKVTSLNSSASQRVTPHALSAPDSNVTTSSNTSLLPLGAHTKNTSAH